jgi:hypothetical protein
MRGSTTALRCLAAAVVAGLLAGSGLAEENSAATIRGEVEAAQYDDQDRVIQVSIFDGEWGAVLVLNEGRGRELLKHVGAIVSATGQLSEIDDESGYLYAIRVESYKLDETDEPQEEPEDEPAEEPEPEPEAHGARAPRAG